MRIRNFFPMLKSDSQVLAAFGEAKLVQYLDGKLELKGGSNSDRIAAREWISLFMHEAVAREV